MRDWRYNQRIAAGSRVVRRPERRPVWWEGLSWDTLLAYGITAIVSLAFLWLLAQIALEIAAVVFLVALLSGAVLAWRRWRHSSH